MKTIKLNENINLHVVQSKKYKDISIYLNLYNKLDKQSRIVRALLTYIIGDRSDMYPSKVDMTSAKDMLYGAEMGIGNLNIASGHVVQIASKILNERFTNDDTLRKFIEFLKDIILNPIIDDEGLMEAKRNLRDYSLRKLDKPMSFAISRAYEIYGKGTHLEDGAIIAPEDIDQFTLNDLKQAHKAMIANDNIDIFVFGDVEPEYIGEMFEGFFGSNLRVPIKHIVQPIAGNAQCEEITETKQINQSSLIMVYKTNIDKKSANYCALKATNSLLGLVPASLLFQEVREKNSLCYSISSSVLADEGVIMIRTGIDTANADKVIELVKQQVNRIRTGDFETKVLEECIKLYVNLLNGTSDDIVQTMNYEYSNFLEKKKRKIDEDIRVMCTVNKEIAMKVFENMELKLVYLLKNDEQEIS